MNTFRAQTLSESDITEDQTRFELTFVDAVGHKHKLNIPVPLAGDLIKVLGTVASCAPPDSGNFTRLPHEFAVGHAVAERMVLLRFDKEPPYAIGVETAELLTHELQAQIEYVSVLRRPPMH